MEIVRRTTGRMAYGETDRYTHLVETADGQFYSESKDVPLDMPEAERGAVLAAHFAAYEDWLLRALRKHSPP